MHQFSCNIAGQQWLCLLSGSIYWHGGWACMETVQWRGENVYKQHTNMAKFLSIPVRQFAYEVSCRRIQYFCFISTLQYAPRMKRWKLQRSHLVLHMPWVSTYNLWDTDNLATKENSLAPSLSVSQGFYSHPEMLLLSAQHTFVYRIHMIKSTIQTKLHVYVRSHTYWDWLECWGWHLSRQRTERSKVSTCKQQYRYQNHARHLICGVGEGVCRNLAYELL